MIYACPHQYIVIDAIEISFNKSSSFSSKCQNNQTAQANIVLY